MVKVKLKVVGSLKVSGLVEGELVNAENVLEIVQHQKLLDDYRFNYTIFLNGVNLDNESKQLYEGDEVILVPIMSGG